MLTLKKVGSMLNICVCLVYLPASWFHEVISTHNSNAACNHTALNYWMYPPNAPECTYSEPYIDEYWQKRYTRCLNIAQLRWQSQQLSNIPGAASLVRLLGNLQSGPFSEQLLLDDSENEDDTLDSLFHACTKATDSFEDMKPLKKQSDTKLETLTDAKKSPNTVSLTHLVSKDVSIVSNGTVYGFRPQKKKRKS